MPILADHPCPRAHVMIDPIAAVWERRDDVVITEQNSRMAPELFESFDLEDAAILNMSAGAAGVEIERVHRYASRSGRARSSGQGLSSSHSTPSQTRVVASPGCCP